MKKIILLLFAFVLSSNLIAQNNREIKNNNYLIAKLTSDCPKELEEFKKERSDYDIKFTRLETGLDSLSVFFGSMTKNDEIEHWICSNFKENIFLKGISLKPNVSSNSFTEDITFEINPFDFISPYSVSFRLIYYPIDNKLEYIWFNNDKTNSKASLVKIEKPIQQEKKFPEISFTSITGENISTEDFKDKIVIINWWSTGCAPCIKEIPDLNKIAEKYKSNKDILFLAITADKTERVTKFLDKREFKYKQGLANESVNKIFEGFQPQNIIINKDGITKLFLAGYMEQTPIIIENTIKNLLSEK